MNISSRFDHYNFNVTNLEKSIAFYNEALGLTETRRHEKPDGSFIIVFLEDGKTNFKLELTWLRDWDRPYELGDNEIHLCVRVADDISDVHKHHQDMGCICYENESMGLYFINDPDGYWIEILPEK